jgi:hypothetical protein
VALLVAASLMLSAGASLAQPSDENKAAARALATQGAEALKNGRFAEALDLVSRAEAIVHAPTHLLMIARAQTGSGKLVAAQETYLKLTREELSATAPAAFKNAQATGREELVAIEPRIASLRVVVEGAAQKKATVKLDEVIVPAALLGVFRPIDPGHHVVAVYPVGGSPVKTPLDLRDGEKREIKLAVPEGPPPAGVPVSPVDNPDAGKPPPDTGGSGRDQGASPGFFTPLRGAGIGAGVVGLAGVAVGAAFLAKGLSSSSQANSLAKMVCLPPALTECPKATPAQQAQLTSLDHNGAQQKTIGFIALPVGVAALGAGVALIVIGKPKPAAAAGAGASVTPWFGGTSGGLRGEF